MAFFFLFRTVTNVSAATGINRTINFQGKIVNKADGTNIANTNYSFTFKLYDAGSGGNQLPVGTPWSETQSLTVTDGIFRATLGASTPIPSTLDFNSDSIYLDITFNGETFGSRVRLTAVPYAFNAEKVNGLTVTNTTGTLTIPNGATIAFSGTNNVTLTSSGTTTLNLPTTGTLSTLDGNETFTNKTIGSTGLTFSGAATDITTGTNENLVIAPNGSGIAQFLSNVNFAGAATVSGNLLVNGTGTFASQLLISDGNSSNPGLAFSSNTDMGIYKAAANQMVVKGGTLLQLTAPGQGSVSIYGGNVHIDTPGLADQGFTVQPVTSGDLALAIKGKSGQTADLQQWQDYNGNPLSVMNASGNLGIGTTTADAQIQLVGNAPGMMFDSISSTADWASPYFKFRRARGTPGSLANVLDGDALGVFTTEAYYNGAWRAGAAEISMNVDGNPSGTYVPGRLDFATVNRSGVWGNRLTIRNDGNVGIGTTSPLTLLDVAGDASVSGNLTIGQNDVIRSQYGPLQLAYKNGLNSWLPGLTLQDTTGYVGIGTTAPAATFQVSDKFYVSSSDSVGIGTVPSGASLHVHENSGWNQVYFTNSGTGAGDQNQLWFATGYGGTEKWAGIGQFGSDGGLRLAYNNLSNPAIYIDSGNNVGINSTSPTAQLDVVGSATVSGNLRAGGQLQVGRFGAEPAALGNGSMYYNTTTNKLRCYINGSWADCDTTGAGSPVWSAIQTPVADLSLSMSTYKTTFNWATGTSTNNLFSLTTDASANGTGALLNIQTGSSATVLPLRVRAGSTEALTVMANGNVGIGTTSANSKLDVRGGTISTGESLTPADLGWTPGTGENPNIFNGGSSGGYTYGDLVMANSKASPAAGDYMGDFLFAAKSTGSLDTYTGLKSMVTSQLEGSGGSSAGLGGNLEFWTRIDNGAFGERMRISNNGNIAIGTTDATWGKVGINGGGSGVKSLIVRGNSSDNANLQEWQNNAGTALTTINSNGFIDLTGANGSAAYFNTILKFNSAHLGNSELSGGFDNGVLKQTGATRTLFNYISDTSANSIFSGGVDGEGYRRFALSGGGNWQVGPGTSTQDTFMQRLSSGGMAFSTSLTGASVLTVSGTSGQTAHYFDITSNGGSAGNVMTVDSAGNVGIGTTSPLALLDVAGNASVGGALTLSNGSALQSGYGPLFLNYKSGYNWLPGITLRDNSGNVGIGTINPSDSKVQIVSSNSGGEVVPFAIQNPNTAAGTAVRMIMGATNGISGNLNGRIDFLGTRQSDGSIDFNLLTSPGSATPNSKLYIIGNSGYVGVGTTSPLERLDVAGNASVSGNLTIAQNGALRSQYGPLQLAYKNGLNSWTTGLTLQDSTGYLGIGTTGPSSQLQVFSSTTNKDDVSSPKAVARFQSNMAADENLAAVFESTTDRASRVWFMVNGSARWALDTENSTGNYDYSMWRYNGGWSSALNISNATGNITMPNSASVSANLTTGGQLQVGRFGAEPAALGNGSMYYNTSINKFRCYVNGTWADCAGGAGSPVWSSIQAPAADLSLSMSTYKTTFNWATGTSTNNLFNLTTDASSNGTGYLFNAATGTSSTVKPFHVSAAGTEAILVDAAGNVGVGNLSPLAKLDVTGAASISSTLTIGNGGAIQSAYGPLTLKYKSNLNSWLAGITLQDSTGNVGIGTTGPNQLLDVRGFGIIGNQTSANPASGANTLMLNNRTTDTSQNIMNLQGTLEVNPGADTSKYYYGGFLDASSISGTAINYTGRLVGLQGQVDHNGTGTISEARGIAGFVQNVVSGIITSAYGGRFGIVNSGNGSIGSAYGAYINSASKGSGTITSNYGLYIENQTAGNTNYALYSAGGQSYFAGNVGIGSLTPAANLDVTGTASVSGALTLGNGSALRSAYGPLTLNYKSGLDSWTAGLILSDSTGNVGIGTVTPLEKLQVNGNIIASNSAQRVYITAQSGNTIGPEVRLISTDTGGKEWRLGSSATGNTVPAGGFYIYDATWSYMRMVMDTNGLVGLNTTIPTERLDVRGNATVSGNISLGYQGLLKLGWSNSDPAGSNGSMYYNSNTNVFRCYGNGAWANCGGSGSQTPWTSDIVAAGYDLGDLSNLSFRETTGAPAGTAVGFYRDNSGDLTANVLLGKAFHIAINGADQFSFDGSGLDLADNSITNVGSAITGTGTSSLTISTAAESSLTTGNLILNTGNSTSGSSGDISIDTGQGGGGNGSINIGDWYASTVNIGANSLGITTNIYGDLWLQPGTLPGGVTAGAIKIDSNDSNKLKWWDGSQWQAAGGGSATWSSIGAPGADLSLAMSTYKTTFNWATGTSTNNLFSLTTDASANGTGYLFNVATGASATVKPLRIAAGAVESMMINASGNVGIGTTSPIAKLDVLGEATVSGGLTFYGGARTIASRSMNQLTIGDTQTGPVVVSNNGNFIVSKGAGQNFQVNFTAAPTVDMTSISNSGQATTTTGVDGMYINYNTAGSGAITNAAINIGVTNTNNTAGTVIYGEQIATMSGQLNANETALIIGSGWDKGLDVSSPVSVNSTLTATSGTLIGSTTNGFAFDPAKGPTYTGTARPAKTITLSPEYAGAVLTPFYGAGTDSNITGTMTSDASPSAGLMRTHYSWLSSTASPLQSYTVAVRVTLPNDFSGWAASNAVQVDVDTQSTNTANNAVDINIYNSAGTQVVSSTNNVSSGNNAWTTINIQPASLTNWQTAGQTAVIYLRMRSMNNNFTLVGDIKLNYLGSF